MKLQWDYHVSSFLQAVEKYISEVPYPYTYSEPLAIQQTWQLLNHPDSAIIVHLEDDKVVGGCTVTRNREFWEEYSGTISQFYVLPEWRGTHVSRKVIQEAVDWFDENNCVISFAGSHAGNHRDKLFTNLLLKYGFTQQGTLLVRKGKTQ